jgi:hypothetical protein
MNTKHQRLRAEFEPEVRFEVKTEPPAPFRLVQESRFEALKARLLAERLGRVSKPAWHAPVRYAANEAAALAWVTPYPLLVYPALFAEKAETALRVAERQERVREQSQKAIVVLCA